MLPADTLASRLDNRLKMRHYALLLAIGQHRSLTRVAEQLALTQPTVTRALSDIESIFMTPLFVRTGRGLEPTPAGEVVLAHARFAAADNEALRRELEGIRQGLRGRLRIGLIPYASEQVLDAVWQHLMALRPRIALAAHEDTTQNLLAALMKRELDCAVCRFSHQSTDGEFAQELLYRQQAHLVVARPGAAALRRLKKIDIAQLGDMDWIFPPPETPIRRMIDAIFADAGRQIPAPVLEAYSVRTVASAMRHLPRSITILPNDVARIVQSTGVAVMLPEPLPWALPPVGMAWLRGTPKTAVIQGLVEELRSQLGHHDEAPC